MPFTPARLTALALALLAPAVARAAPVAVTVQDKGRPTKCAEEDNVYAVLAAPGVRRFTVQARTPAYVAQLRRNVLKPNFKDCSFTAAPRGFRFTPRQVTLYDDGQVRVRGITYPAYWRPDRVAVNVAGRKDGGFHLLQLFVKQGGRMQEVMVLHAADGYWRLRPLPPPQFDIAVYGTSFLVGPVEEAGRPFVRIREVDIDPKHLTMRALFAKGGEARLTIAHVDRQALTVKVVLDPVAGGPFVALRSMYVGPDNADTAELHWRTPAGQDRTAPAVGFGATQATALAFSRSIPSRHNPAAPDIAFSDFDSAP
jgi:hypothetical protein